MCHICTWAVFCALVGTDLAIITIHMPQRTSKILLVRLTANRNALLFLIRVTSFARYTVWFGVSVVIKLQQMTTSHSLQLRTLTGFHFTHEDGN